MILGAGIQPKEQNEHDDSFLVKYKPLIEFIQHNVKLKKFPRESQELRKQLQQFIEDIVVNIYPDPPPHFTFDSFSFIQLFNHCNEILEYRTFLGLDEAQKMQMQEDYLTFAKNNRILEKGLRSGNIFLLNEHLINLYNLSMAFQDGGQNRQVQSMSDDEKRTFIHALRDEMVRLNDIIGKLKTEKVGPYRFYLEATTAYAFSSLFSNPHLKSFIFDEHIARFTFQGTYVAARMGEIYLDQQSIKPDSTYHSSPVPRSSSSPSAATSENRYNLKTTELINFYSLGQGLFARIPLNDFNQLQRHVASLDLFSPTELIAFLTEARNKYNELNEQEKRPFRSLRKPDLQATEMETTPTNRRMGANRGLMTRKR